MGYILALPRILSKVYVHIKLEPIFHCNAKPLALGVRVGQYPQRKNFALGVPLDMLVSKKPAEPTRTLNATPNANVLGLALGM